MLIHTALLANHHSSVLLDWLLNAICHSCNECMQWIWLVKDRSLLKTLLNFKDTNQPKTYMYMLTSILLQQVPLYLAILGESPKWQPHARRDPRKVRHHSELRCHWNPRGGGLLSGDKSSLWHPLGDFPYSGLLLSRYVHCMCII